MFSTRGAETAKPLRQIEFWKQRLIGFLFPCESDNWLALLRFGLGLQIILYCLSIRRDWTYLLAGSGGLISRNLSETILALESPLIPRLGWIVAIGDRFGLSEEATLSLVWYSLITAACFLFLGAAGTVLAFLIYKYVTNRPEEHPRVNAAELAIIRSRRVVK